MEYIFEGIIIKFEEKIKATKSGNNWDDTFSVQKLGYGGSYFITKIFKK